MILLVPAAASQAIFTDNFDARPWSLIEFRLESFHSRKAIEAANVVSYDA
jgi:hypothetical protein